MPELPEVETVARGLRTTLPGRRIVSVRLGKADFVDDPVALERDLPGCRIVDITRHGKYLVLRLERPLEGSERRNPAGVFSLLVHLGMTGQLASRWPEEPAAPHTHAFFSLDDGRELRYADIRRFGRLALLPEPQLGAFLAVLGADPLEVSHEEFRRRLGGRRAMVKALLLDQRVLRGMGNIYADESLWRAGVHPRRKAARLTRGEIGRLYVSIRGVLRAAIRLRGSSISNFVDADGQPGGYQRRHRVYGREGEECFRCGRRIRRVVVAGRSSYFCPRCQRAPRR